jgi:26S proteasome regulatory subunit N5
MDEPVQKMEKDCSAIVDAQFPEIDAAAKVLGDIRHLGFLA